MELGIFLKIDVVIYSATCEQTHCGLKDVVPLIFVQHRNKLLDSCVFIFFFNFWRFFLVAHPDEIDHSMVFFVLSALVNFIHSQKQELVCRFVRDNQAGERILN